MTMTAPPTEDTQGVTRYGVAMTPEALAHADKALALQDDVERLLAEYRKAIEERDEHIAAAFSLGAKAPELERHFGKRLTTSAIRIITRGIKNAARG